MKNQYRVLICGSRHWAHPLAVTRILDALDASYGGSLVVIEGAAAGADWAAHEWCETHGLALGSRHRCFPVDWAKARKAGGNWKLAGPDRNARMAAARPDLVIAFHELLTTDSGGTSDMVMKARQCKIPVTRFIDAHGTSGHVPTLDEFTEYRRRMSERMLIAHRAPIKERLARYQPRPTAEKLF